jgi:spermidine dehydrogenase
MRDDKSLSRRDFLNGALLAAGGLAVRGSMPMRVLAAAQSSACDGPIGLDPRARRGGNLPDAFRIAHWMRDRRLMFSGGTVTLAKGCDAYAGTFDIADDGGRYDVVIAGSGIAGLSTAFYLRERRRSTRILILDANSDFGGNARRDDQPPLPVMASTAGSYCVAPYADFQREVYGKIGLRWEQYKIVEPFYSYYFDDRTPGVRTGYRGWNIDTYGAGLAKVPYSNEIVRQLVRCKDEFRRLSQLDGSPTDPPDESDRKYDNLSRISFDEYLRTELRCDPLVSDFYTRYTVDALGGTTKQVNAHSTICFLGGEYAAPFAFPGGNAGLARLLLKYLIAGAFPGDAVTTPARTAALDRQENTIRLRQDAVVVRADPDGVVYHKGGRFYRARARTIVLATGSHSARHLIEHLAERRRMDAWRRFNTVPVVVANVTVRTAAPFVDLGLGYNQYWWGGKYWADFVIADWAGARRTTRDRPTVLTFFGGNEAGPSELAGERVKLLSTPFGDYEQSLREDLSRIMTGTAFDFDRDVSAIYLYRWGHGMIMPTPGHIFGSGTNRDDSPRRMAAAPMGTISFAGQDTEGTPSVECALASGRRAAQEALKHL